MHFGSPFSLPKIKDSIPKHFISVLFNNFIFFLNFNQIEVTLRLSMILAEVMFNVDQIRGTYYFK